MLADRKRIEVIGTQDYDRRARNRLVFIRGNKYTVNLYAGKT